MSKKEIYIKDIGLIKLNKNYRAKRLSIRIQPFKGVSVTIPPSVSYKYAEKFILEKKNWILKSLSKMDKIEKKQSVFLNNSVFKTKYHTILFENYNGTNLKYTKKENKILVYFPKNINVRDQKTQKTFRYIIEETWRDEAKTILPKLVNDFAKKYNFKYNQIKIQNSKTRWGSCSSKNNINLSLHLMKLPEHLIDYVILHELCHTIEKNHGKNFWKLLDKVSGNAKALNKELKNYSANIF